jgi:hypothetical protein
MSLVIMLSVSKPVTMPDSVMLGKYNEEVAEVVAVDTVAIGIPP